ncbi:hypothetical protein EVG20_g4027 [Dentipellis fragilis]|uniref:DASH complex subunit DAD4 n=1 Tax=Dentipellis fragilis TaxID=205917 RepID=A0A4Y9YX84_9AGAM|nr:hypothetical protein EVG20_g4027 [Dentipellis fragilis]
MENPHAERQAVLLERIVKNADKCTELILELNHCVEVRIFFGTPGPGMCAERCSAVMNELCMQEVLRANAYVKTAADLVTKYRKNVQYNLEATRELESAEAEENTAREA